MTTDRGTGEAESLALATAGALGGLATTVQQTHRAIAARALGRVPVLAAAQHAWASAVYGAVRVGIAVVGTAAAVALGSAERTRNSRPWTGRPGGRRLAGVVNGAFGDRLVGRYARLSSPLGIRADGRDVACDRAALSRQFPDAAPEIVVFVHGVIENEEWWFPPPSDEEPAARDFGARLRDDLGRSSVHIRYNSGRHVSDNGAELDALLADLVGAWPVPVRGIALVGHSMGGLVARSAVHQATARRGEWVRLLRHVVCLGTPHTGASLERGVNRLVVVMRRFDESRPLAELLAARSAGIKDLRHGYLDRRDWFGIDPDAVAPNPGRAAYTCSPTVRHGDIAATLSRDPESVLARWCGDLLVRPDGALDRQRSVHLQQLGGLSHRDLLTHDEAYRHLRDWLSR